MDRCSLELTLTATEGAIHNLGTLICMAWATASTHNPLHQEWGTAAVLTRPDGGWGNLEAKELAVSTEELAVLIGLMRQLRVPHRLPRVHARSGNTTGWQKITLDVALDGQRGHLSFGLQYAGMDGEDAGPCIAMLERLFDLLGVGYLGRWVRPG